MAHPETCTFAHKNDILSRIEETLCWTKNEKNTWYDDPFSTTIATTVLLKLGHSEEDLNLKWIEDLLEKFNKNKDHFNNVTFFCAFCLGLLVLNFSNRKNDRETIKLVSDLMKGLDKLNWMNTPKTLAFLILLVKETEFMKKVTDNSLLSKIEDYIQNFVEHEKRDLEKLSYGLFTLSLLKPDVVKKYVIGHPEIITKLTNHNRIELRTLTLDALDKAEIPCAEGTYKGVLEYFNKKSYGIVERSIIQRIISSVYSKLAGLPFDQPDITINEDNDCTYLKIKVAKPRLDEMIKNAPPIDQLSIVALSILLSNYDKLYLFSRRRYEEYDTLSRLEQKETHLPVEKEALTRLSKTVFRYELIKILWKYGIFTVIGSLLLPIIVYYITTFIPLLPHPWDNALGAGLALILGVSSFYKWIFSRGKRAYVELKDKIKEMETKGKWQDS